MRNRIPLFLLIFCLWACEKKEEKPASFFNFLPQNPSLLIKVNHINDYNAAWENSPFAANLKLNLPDSLFTKLSGLQEVETNNGALLSIYPKDSSLINLLLIIEKPFTFQPKDSTMVKESVSFGASTYQKIELNTSTYYLAESNRFTLLSTDVSLLNEAMSEKEEISLSPSLLKIYGGSSSKKLASFYINLKQSSWLASYAFKEDASKKLLSIGDWVTFDFDSSENFAHFRGISMSQDSLPKTIDLFRNSKPIPLSNSATAPFDTDAFLSFSIDDHETFSLNQQEHLKLENPIEGIFHTVDELSLLRIKGKKAVFLHTYGTQEINPFLEGRRRNEISYQGHEVYQLTEGSFLVSYFQPLLTDFIPKYYAILENTYLFSDDLKTIKTIIDDNSRANTLDKNPLFKSAMSVLSDESNMIFISNSQGIKDILNEFGSLQLNRDLAKSIDKDYVYAGQIITDKGFYHTNLVMQKKQIEEASLSTSIALRVELESDLATNPQFVLNHRNGEKEIVVQDIDNNLYLINNKGEILWKKTLQGRIQGDISQVDLYKNKRLQLAFTTNDQFLILDRNGKEVEPFDMKFPGGNLNGLAVFDYDNKKNYRFVISQGTNISMFNNKGKKVTGFKYNKADSQVLMPPKHIRIGRKDYIVFMLEDGSLKILNRTGRTRVNVKEKIDFSGNETYLFKGNFVTTNKKGTLFAISPKGKITKSKLATNSDHGIVTTNKTFVLQNENILQIRGHEVNLELGVYSKPQLFYVNNKIYISVTDIQSRKVYLFDSAGKSISDFPVFGNYKIDLHDIDKDNKIEIVTKEQDNALIVYRIN